MDELQKSINRMMGVTDETWGKYNPEEREREKRIRAISLKIDEVQESINKIMGVTHIKNIRKMDEIQKSINTMMGITDMVWEKYGPKYKG